MICFFCFTQNLKVNHREGHACYQHCFEAVQDTANIPVDKIYFSTPSDFYNQLNNIQKQLGDKAKNIAFAIDSQTVASIERFPVDIGFSNLEQKLLPFKGKSEIKIAILNAMSNAIGDHLIGMRAFDYWHNKVCELLPETKVSISFFQLDPNGMSDVTRQSADKIDHLYMLPNNASLLLQHDAYIDLGTLLLREGFDTDHMIDFFFKSFSIDAASVPLENKRMKFDISQEISNQIGSIIKTIRSKQRPILLFHRTSSSRIREISSCKARKVIAEIIDKSDYFVVAADGLEYQNERFVDLHNYSNTVEHFAAIISQVDAIVTVDTCTYHLADAFNIPTVALFSTIEPDLRTRYYPNVKSIMYEEKGGSLYGRHKDNATEVEVCKDMDYIEKIWEKIDVDEILSLLKQENS